MNTLQTRQINENICVFNIKDIKDFDADPFPGSALENKDLDPGHEHFFFTEFLKF